MIFFHVVFLFPRHISLFFLPFRLYLLLSFSSQPCGFPSLMLTFNSSFFLLFQSLISQTCFYFWGFFVSFLSPFIFFLSILVHFANGIPSSILFCGYVSSSTIQLMYIKQISRKCHTLI